MGAQSFVFAVRSIKVFVLFVSAAMSRTMSRIVARVAHTFARVLQSRSLYIYSALYTVKGTCIYRWPRFPPGVSIL
ncbi:hypothetical protein F5884DRAFT_790006 [Xylogone sp. PMI_703]|nr:hypothetical protein F5884DRAFT_790006 [Xylogone sp. PMI_703]